MIPAQFDPKTVEKKWYDYWMENKYFRSTPDHRKPYTITIPPPNVTGVLHMGHMLNNTIQDVLIRRARLKGFNACWVPGTDHASIATEAKVVAKLKAEGINKNDLSREEFLKHAWDWTHKYGGTILEQLKQLGCSCDWDRTKFTMDDDMTASVIKSFVDLYNKGMIYRGYRMVNWDPEAKTTLSDEEVIYEERQGKLYHLRYKIEDSNEFVTIATTRPETILGDTAICIHPEDERYQHLKGKKAIVPICNRVIPIIFDEYVDIEFGTGCLKVTPAHDINDKELGNKHNLEIIDIFNEDATLNSFGLHYVGKDRFVVRDEIAKELETIGALVKTENHLNKVGTSERTKAVIEPRLSDQWFLRMEELVKPAIKAVLETEEVKLYPSRFNNTYRHWMENIRDWNISRQLWWGQQIPAYYYGEGKEDFVVAETKEQALELAKQKTKNQELTKDDLKQDVDALDTWFSSWLWPMAVFGGVLDPENKDFKYYYPTNDLVTGPDILFFWVARMIIAGYEYADEKPFTNVYLTGLVRDKQGRKMSKSLGNSPDPLDLIDKFGADGVRCGLLLSAAAGNDILFDEELCNQGKSFANKIWNAFRLIKGWEVADIVQPEASKSAIAWYEAKLQKTLAEIEDNFEKYRISDALMAIYKLVWDDFCSWFLEMIKPGYQQPIDKTTFDKAIEMLEANLKLLHPFMPFLTEEIWQYIADRKTPEEALIVAQWPEIKTYDEKLISDFDFATEVISGIRTIRKDKNISFKDTIELKIVNNEKASTFFDTVIAKLGNLSNLEYVSEKVNGALSYRVKSNEYFIPIGEGIDIEAEIKKLTEELNYTKGFLKSVQGKLSNEKFVSGAPEQVIANERKKEADALAKIATIEQSLAGLK
ncbi:valine--tRNA ligase [Flavobacterium columnare]|uniref:Valine--tRNA ligase n=1 Tax=Flavobacterium columnare (strain ATCC 49512 / CIP 103533 / TG 44/87) TaxID=1041826 RepID=G8X859_FLACA|nr:valine--tRNA ligase [Flavobacterium columnare]AEW84996.1 valyl-tRNA synthetase [Flavobacterium columnare ATCC 49512]ANO49230.1 valyl-tRNA ligase [Flavobacterium columnare]APT22781.1 valine--tRNA ligase [Flavobacterium columnare]MEB3800121.1 valine--tRNA ligase [Flavobacterium columnare]OOB84338.1 valine--tRNA ligase [Flavobacterium columnare]